MRSFGWIASRVTAAVVGALLVGLIAGAILSAIWAFTCGPACYSTEFDAHGHSKCLAYTSTCENFFDLFSWGLVSITAFVLGTLPGIAALTLTPAKTKPWRSLFVLVPATSVGFAAWLLLDMRVHFERSSSWWLWLVTLVVLPSSTGLLAAWNIERFPRRLQFTLKNN